MKKEVVITKDIIKYIISKKIGFDIIPKEGSVWKVKKITSYPNVNGGLPVIELENNDGEWLRLPYSIIS
jgi:hypothetical protein